MNVVVPHSSFIGPEVNGLEISCSVFTWLMPTNTNTIARGNARTAAGRIEDILEPSLRPL
jgi:hypothetical protein